MGAGCSSSTVVQPSERSMETEAIDRLLEESAAREELHFKILCLGAGESGKSTIVKQLTFIHKQQLTREERLSYIKVLQNNTISCMITLIREAEGFGYEFMGDEKVSVDAICGHDQRLSMPYEICNDIHKLWQCGAIQRTYARRNEFWHLEATEYYFNNVDRYTSDGFIPTEEDIVMARKRTTGVVVTELDYGGIHWSCVDVGGQRSERRKWLNCFDNVKAIIYVVNLAGYCKVLFEDKAVNRMHESLNLFEATMSNPLFAATPVFIFLNKKDIFEASIREKSIDCCFPDYNGGNDLHSSIEYITEEYSKRLPPHSPKPTFLLLAARMKKDVQYCFEEVKDILLEHHKKGISKAKKALERVEKRNKQVEGDSDIPGLSIGDEKIKVRGLQGFEYNKKPVVSKTAKVAPTPAAAPVKPTETGTESLAAESKPAVAESESEPVASPAADDDAITDSPATAEADITNDIASVGDVNDEEVTNADTHESANAPARHPTVSDLDNGHAPSVAMINNPLIDSSATREPNNDDADSLIAVASAAINDRVHPYDSHNHGRSSSNIDSMMESMIASQSTMPAYHHFTANHSHVQASPILTAASSRLSPKHGADSATPRELTHTKEMEESKEMSHITNPATPLLAKSHSSHSQLDY